MSCRGGFQPLNSQQNKRLEAASTPNLKLDKKTGARQVILFLVDQPAFDLSNRLKLRNPINIRRQVRGKFAS